MHMATLYWLSVYFESVQTIVLYLLPVGTVTEGGSAVEANFVEFPNSEKIVDLAMAATYVMAVSENGNIYYWGKNSVWYD